MARAAIKQAALVAPVAALACRGTPEHIAVTAHTPLEPGPLDLLAPARDLLDSLAETRALARPPHALPALSAAGLGVTRGERPRRGDG